MSIEVLSGVPWEPYDWNDYDRDQLTEEELTHAGLTPAYLPADNDGELAASSTPESTAAEGEASVSVDQLVDQILTDTNSEDDDERPRVFSDVYAFVTDFLAYIYERRENNQAHWCPQWWMHPGALYRFTILWHSWERMHASSDPVSEVQWLTYYADPIMRELLNPEGTFYGCNGSGPQRGHSPRRPHEGGHLPTHVPHHGFLPLEDGDVSVYAHLEEAITQHEAGAAAHHISAQPDAAAPSLTTPGQAKAELHPDSEAQLHPEMEAQLHSEMPSPAQAQLGSQTSVGHTPHEGMADTAQPVSDTRVSARELFMG